MGQDNFYYSSNELRTKDKILNYVLANRNAGKTYEFKDVCIKDYKKKKRRFIWMRRYGTELKVCRNLFHDLRSKYPDDKFTFKGGRYYINGELFGYLVPLSQQGNMRSADYENVDKIIFDEFQISEKTFMKYLRNEVKELLTFMDTVTRMKETTENIILRTYCLGNTYSIVNPHFIYWGITPDMTKRFTIKKEVCIEVFNAKEMIEARYQTRFGQLVKEVDYSEMAFENTFEDDKFDFIVPKKPKHAIYFCTLKIQGKYIGVWVDNKKYLLYLNTSINETCKKQYCFDLFDLEENFILVKNHRHYPFVSAIVNCAKENKLRYKNLEVQNMVIGILSSMRIY